MQIVLSSTKQIQFFLLRGLSREIRHWGRFPHILSSCQNTVEVYPLELPGAGTLRNLQSPYSVSHYCKPLRKQFCSARNRNSTRIIIGLSFGGMIAAHWLAQYRKDFHAAVLINTSGNQSPLYQRLLPNAALALCKAGTMRDTAAREFHIAKILCNTSSPELLASQWAYISRTAPITLSNTMRQLIAASLFRFPDNVACPLLLIKSLNDRLISPLCTDRIGKLLGCDVLSHQTGGHDLPTDEPEWCVETIFHWLNKTVAQERAAFLP